MTRHPPVTPESGIGRHRALFFDYRGELRMRVQAIDERGGARPLGGVSEASACSRFTSQNRSRTGRHVHPLVVDALDREDRARLPHEGREAHAVGSTLGRLARVTRQLPQLLEREKAIRITIQITLPIDRIRLRTKLGGPCSP